ncbi:AbiJ-NTD4 domain-containing protein [Rhizobium sp.]|uniref:AbiJ-NTD4 domain-containing protein n=1 Tax=Rhizobium sp. TaxID=391 RepID=UPI00289A6F0A
MNNSDGSFSDRFGYRASDAKITIREDAPEVVREAITMLGFAFDIGPNGMRDLICEVLLKRPDPGNWSAGNVEHEVHFLMAGAPWYKVYDVVERLYQELGRNDYDGERQRQFSVRLNAVFRELGVGWQLENGKLVVRGSEPYNLAIQDAVATMREAGTPTASNEIHEAIRDISRRPQADVTGAIQHAMAALECVAREVDGSKDTLGKIINRLTLPPPLDRALHTLWGFASEQGRHIQEGRVPRFEEAELVVTVASAVSVYLLRQRASSTS